MRMTHGTRSRAFTTPVPATASFSTSHPKPRSHRLPGSDDGEGCEDPTVVLVDSVWHVWYSGWNQRAERGSMLLARGRSEHALHKDGLVFAPSSRRRNPKEASLARCADGTWCLFFEFVNESGSEIGIARAPALLGPWRIEEAPPFAPRPGMWDDYHLSPGPILAAADGEATMLYNGASQAANWRIGWITFDENFRVVRERCTGPAIVPPPVSPGEGDMAFAASAIEERDRICVYYTVADKMMKRAVLRRT